MGTLKFFFLIGGNDIKLYSIKSRYTMGKRKEGHSSNQTMASSSSFAVLAKAKAAWLHRKGILSKEKLSLIKLMSSMI